jgi:hypothetical protein
LFSVNGHAISHELFQATSGNNTARTASVEIDGTTYALTMNRDRAASDYRGTGHSFDNSWKVSIEAQGDPGQLKLNLRNTANDSTDEHFGIANMQVSHN